MNKHLLAGLGLAVGFAACLNACNPEEYGPCSIPDTTAYKQACSPQGEQKTATCAADYVFDCDSLICGRYESSDAFCTYRCIPDSKTCSGNFCGCPAGKKCKETCPEGAACVEWIPGTSNYYCLPADKGTAPERHQSTSPTPVTDPLACTGTATTCVIKSGLNGGKASKVTCADNKYRVDETCESGKCNAAGTDCEPKANPGGGTCEGGVAKNDKKCIEVSGVVYSATCDGSEFQYGEDDKCDDGCDSDGKSCKASGPIDENACSESGSKKCIEADGNKYSATCDGTEYKYTETDKCEADCDASTGECVTSSVICTPDEKKCDSETAIVKCSADGTSWEPERTCDSGLKCVTVEDASVMVDCAECAAGESKCAVNSEDSASYMYECENGRWTAGDVCPSVCKADNSACEPEPSTD